MHTEMVTGSNNNNNNNLFVLLCIWVSGKTEQEKVLHDETSSSESDCQVVSQMYLKDVQLASLPIA